MFERFTERARQVIILAQEEARALKHNYIGTEHVLLGLLREEEGLAARALASLGVTQENVRTAVLTIVGEGEKAVNGQIPFTPRAKKILELALREALSLGHSYIGTEHILLGLIRENEGVAARILLDLGTDAESIRNEVIRLLSQSHQENKRSENVVRDADEYQLSASGDDAIARKDRLIALLSETVHLQQQEIDHLNLQIDQERQGHAAA
jgi:ATP-dependent Clp protease ATP-binding subunit ClpA